MEAFLAIHGQLELPIGCQGDGPRGGLSKAGWNNVYFIQRDCVTRRNEAEPQKPRVNSSNRVFTVGDRAEHFRNRDMSLQQVIIRKWPRLPELKTINSFFKSLLNLLQNCFCFMPFFFFFPTGHVGSSLPQPRIEPTAPTVEAQNLNHWIVRKVR